MLTRWIFAAILSAANVVALFGAETDSPESLVRAAYSAFGSGDGALVQRITTPKAEAIPALSRAIIRRCWIVQAVVINSQEIAGDHATLRATALVVKPGAGSLERTSIEDTIVEMHRPGGVWLIDRWVPAEEPLVDRFIAATEPQRRLLLESSDSLLTPAASRILAM